MNPAVELLAPAGNWDCARAAVENGADAIYFGLDAGFNARARAANFHVDDLPRLMEMLHRQAVLGYVTLNTLVFTDELESLEANVRSLAAAGVDAVLVQDLGVARLIRELCPTLHVHASTQMTLTNAASIELAEQLGIRRAVLARELSISEIRKIAAATQMPLEVFVHGALCVAYSGQCLTSESFGGRSANRGQCAQACRLPYDLYCDGEQRDLGNVRYLLSPQDLAAHDYIPQLIEAGVCSLKIEGRLKTPEYVANVCSHYRAAIDAALQHTPRKLTKSQSDDLAMSFSRGFSPGWLEGCDHKRLVPGLSSAKRGVLLGTIDAVHRGRMTVTLCAPLAIGDGIVIEGDRFAGEEIGGRVYELWQITGKKSNAKQNASKQDASKRDAVQRKTKAKTDSCVSGTVEIAMQRGVLEDFEASELIGLQVWKTDDPKLTKRLRKTFSSADPKKRVAVDVSGVVETGTILQLTVSTEDSGPTVVSVEHTPEVAKKHPLDESTLRQQLSRLGGTVYELRNVDVAISGKPMVPLSVLGNLRHQIVLQLDQVRKTQSQNCAAEPVAVKMLCSVSPSSLESETPERQSQDDNNAPCLRVLCRSLKQLEQVLHAGERHVIADFHDIREYREAVKTAHAAAAVIEIATLRIHKPGEDGLFRALHKVDADAWLVRNLAAVRYCQEHQIPFACDFSLNVTNPLTAEQLIDWGASRVTTSYDLNRDQMVELVERMPPSWAEIVIHQHMPMFHMEHCVFCSVLSPGKNKSDCGRPCDRHEVDLRDRVGSKHVLHADIGCRNTLYNGTAQSGAESVEGLLQLGIRQFRIELLRDAGSGEVTKLLSLYRDLLAGRLNGTQVWKNLKADNRIGVTRGTLEQPRNPLAIL